MKQELKISNNTLEKIKVRADVEAGADVHKDKQLLKYFLQQEARKLQADSDLRFQREFQVAKRMLDRYRLEQEALE